MSLTPSPTDAAVTHRLPESRAVQIALGTLSVLLVALFYALCVIRNFDGPIGDAVESFLYEYLPVRVATPVVLADSAPVFAHR